MIDSTGSTGTGTGSTGTGTGTGTGSTRSTGRSTGSTGSTNWREDYLHTKAHLSKRQIQLLTNGADSLAASWILQAMYNDWKRSKGYREPTPPDCSSSFLEFSKKTTRSQL